MQKQLAIVTNAIRLFSIISHDDDLDKSRVYAEALAVLVLVGRKMNFNAWSNTSLAPVLITC